MTNKTILIPNINYSNEYYLIEYKQHLFNAFVETYFNDIGVIFNSYEEAIYYLKGTTIIPFEKKHKNHTITFNSANSIIDFPSPLMNKGITKLKEIFTKKLYQVDCSNNEFTIKLIEPPKSEVELEHLTEFYYVFATQKEATNFALKQFNWMNSYNFPLDKEK